MDGIYLEPPEGDDSDGYDVSDTEEGQSAQISRTILQAHVAEVRTVQGDVVLEDLLGQPELPDLESESEPEPAPKRTKTARTTRTEFKWEESTISFRSRALTIFPQPNYTMYKSLPPKGLYDKIVDKELLDCVRDLSNQYAMAKFGTSYNIMSEEINIFFAILLLSGYNPVADYDLYWSNSEDCANRMVKAAMARDRFRIIKKCIHF